jgi:transposase
MISGHGSSHYSRVRTGGGAARSVATARSLKGLFTGTAAALPGGTCLLSSVRGRRYGSGTAVSRPTGRGIGSTESCWQKQMPPDRSTGQFRWTRPSTEPTSTGRTFPAPQGELPNYKKLFAEPPDHAIGRSRGGLGTKIHHACDGKGRPLAMILGPGQGGDSPMFPVVMEAVRVPRLGGGRARTRPDAVMGDKAYSSRANRSLLRGRGIKAVIPEPSDQIGHRKRRGSRGGRPVNFDAETYKGRNTVERSFSLFKQWRAIATRYDKLALTYRAGVVLYAVVIWLRQ